MPSVTVVWVSKSSAASRVLSVPRAAVIGLVGGFAALLVVSVASLAWVHGLRARAAEQARDLAALEEQLAEHRVLLAETRAEKDGLAEQSRQMGAELERIREAEGKIRRFLGLKEPVYDATRAHQGGSTAGPAAGPSDAPAPGPLGALEGGGGFDTADTVYDGLQEVLAHLEERREVSRRIPMILPVTSDEAWLSCAFGWRKDPITGTRKEFHNGIDIAGPWKDPILAPADGTVIRAGKDRLLGRYVKLRHSSRIKTLYGHMAALAVKTGQAVKRGDVLGYMGNSGRSTGTHVHYSVSVDGKYVDPQDYILDRPFRTLKL